MIPGDPAALLVAQDLEAPLAWREGQPISARQFLADALAQAERLPARGPMINLCVDRYHFAVGLAAGLLRGHLGLLPPNVLPQTLAALDEHGNGLYILGDGAAWPDVGVPQLQVFNHHADERQVHAVPRIAGRQLAVCLLTSGSTGAPQPHAKRWDDLVLNIGAAGCRLAELMQRSDLRGLAIVATVPAQHSYGLESTVLLALRGGASFDAGRPYFPADIVESLRRVPRPRALVTTPFHLKTLLQSGIDLPPVDLLLSATAPLSAQLAQQAEQAFGGPLVEIYGCTEAGQVASRRTVLGDLWQTFGLLTISCQAVGDGTPEHFTVSGGHVRTPTPLADILQLESPDRFRLLGRANDLIHVAGKRSSLGHLNFHLNSIEGVLDGAFWLPDEIVDAVVRPIAFVVAPQLDAARIVAALRTRIEAVFVPRRIVFVDALPREATGKLSAQAMRRMAEARLDGREP